VNWLRSNSPNIEPIRSVAVIVPAHNEEDLLPGCLAALEVAAARSPVRVRTIVVLDACEDASERICRKRRVEVALSEGRNVGLARSIGSALALSKEACLRRVWLAHTDADTRVGPDWLVDQIELANGGADVVLGVVRLADVSADEHRAFRSAYLRRIRADGTHDHIHGANLGVRASAYRQAGGFPSEVAHEDRVLVRRLQALPGVNLVRDVHLSVDTSSRLAGRCQEGFAATLSCTHPSPG
jgi:cellulose synthase/poly-beta-1,6-N-acetylglucosamine synthase-like glycosyltransferase